MPDECHRIASEGSNGRPARCGPRFDTLNGRRAPPMLFVPFAALATLGALLFSIVATIRASARVDRAAVWLLVRYALGAAFAGYRNAGVWWLNRD